MAISLRRKSMAYLRHPTTVLPSKWAIIYWNTKASSWVLYLILPQQIYSRTNHSLQVAQVRWMYAQRICLPRNSARVMSSWRFCVIVEGGMPLRCTTRLGWLKRISPSAMLTIWASSKTSWKWMAYKIVASLIIYFLCTYLFVFVFVLCFSLDFRYVCSSTG